MPDLKIPNDAITESLARTAEAEAKAVADRRSFLKLAGASAVTGGAAIAGVDVATAAPLASADTTGAYHETEHIRRYYDSAR